MNAKILKKFTLVSFRDYLNNASTKYWKIILFFLSLLFLTYIQYYDYKTPQYSLKLNTVAKKGIKAPIDFNIDDESATLLKIEEAKLNSLVALRLVSGIHELNRKIISEQFNKLIEIKNSDLKDKEKKAEYFKILRSFNISENEIEQFVDVVNLNEVEKFIVINLDSISREGIARDKDWILNSIKEQGKSIQGNIVLVRGSKQETITTNQVMTVAQALTILEQRTLEQYPDHALARKVVNMIFEYYVEPNLEVDIKTTRILEQEAVRKVDTVKRLIRQGQTIIRDGDIVREEHVKIINSLNEQVISQNKFLVILGFGLFNLVLMLMFVYYSRKFSKADFDLNQLILITATLFITVFISNIFLFQESISQITGYSVPTAMFSMLISILIAPKLAIVAVVLLSLYLASLTGFNLNYLVISMITGIVGALATRSIRKRNDLIRATFYVIVAAVFAIISIRLINNQAIFTNDLISGILGGAFSFMLLIGLLPLYDNVLDVTYNLNLLELTDLSHPLLVEMALKAPGTYQHSLTVGVLAEAGAKAIGANTLLARVGAYFHDIGKITKPDFFVENQKYKRNPHDKISPFMSAKIIISHVKDGVTLGKEYKLPRKVIDIIEQHQGDMTLYHFYKRASEESTKEKVQETEFRYPGPKPISPEAAIVMLADKVEAMSKLLKEPTHKNIKEMVMTTFKQLLLDDQQFQDCKILLSDLYKVVNAIIVTLDGMYHSRIEYETDKKNGESSEQEPDEE